jgi:hypothetical protein
MKITRTPSFFTQEMRHRHMALTPFGSPNILIFQISAFLGGGEGLISRLHSERQLPYMAGVSTRTTILQKLCRKLNDTNNYLHQIPNQRLQVMKSSNPPPEVSLDTPYCIQPLAIKYIQISPMDDRGTTIFTCGPRTLRVDRPASAGHFRGLRARRAMICEGIGGFGFTARWIWGDRGGN